MQLQNKSFVERIVHAIGFEVIAVMICAPVGALLLNRSLVQVGALAIMLSTLAMLWNIVYNTIFDRFWPVNRVARGLKVRIFHALGFEGGLVLFGLPLAAFMLNISLGQAFIMEIGFFLFFLPYTMFYNWAYDRLRQRWFEARPALAPRVK